MYGCYWKPLKEITAEARPEGSSTNPQPTVSTATPTRKGRESSEGRLEARDTMTNPVDLTQFSQWLMEQQGTQVKSLWEEQKQAQESLV